VISNYKGKMAVKVEGVE